MKLFVVPVAVRVHSATESISRGTSGGGQAAHQTRRRRQPSG